jgi:hypothetical protein
MLSWFLQLPARDLRPRLKRSTASRGCCPKADQVRPTTVRTWRLPLSAGVRRLREAGYELAYAAMRVLRVVGEDAMCCIRD